MDIEQIEKLGEGKGIWNLVYGEITDEIEYSYDNYIFPDYRVGYCKIKTARHHTIPVFFSLSSQKEIMTTIGLESNKQEIDNIVFHTVEWNQDLLGVYEKHKQVIENLDILANKKEIETRMKKKPLPEKLYQMVKKIAETKIQRLESISPLSAEMVKRYVNFVEEKFKKFGSGKGEWVLRLGEGFETIKYTNENYINKDGSIFYCKIKKKDGSISHCFLSKIKERQILTASGMLNNRIELEDMDINFVDLRLDLESHYRSHIQLFQNNSPDCDADFFKKNYDKNNLPDLLPSLIKKVVVKTMGLYNVWSAEKIDNILRKHLKKYSTGQ